MAGKQNAESVSPMDKMAGGASHTLEAAEELSVHCWDLLQRASADVAAGHATRDEYEAIALLNSLRPLGGVLGHADITVESWRHVFDGTANPTELAEVGMELAAAFILCPQLALEAAQATGPEIASGVAGAVNPLIGASTALASGETVPAIVGTMHLPIGQLITLVTGLGAGTNYWQNRQDKKASADR